MKHIILNSFKQLLVQRYLLVLSVVLVLLAVAFAIYIGTSVRASELLVTTHYSAFGITHFYRDQWFYFLGYAIFGALVAGFHIALALKLLEIKGKSLAIFFCWAGIALIVIAWITAHAVLKVAALS